MISTYMWNKMLNGTGVALAVTSVTKSFLDSLVGKTMAQLRATDGVLATSSVTLSNYGISSTRSTASAYKRNVLPVADSSAVGAWDPCASGQVQAIVFCYLVGGAVTKALSTTLTYNRKSISIDDPVGGQLLTGGQAGQVLEASEASASSTAQAIGAQTSAVSNSSAVTSASAIGSSISAVAQDEALYTGLMGAS